LSHSIVSLTLTTYSQLLSAIHQPAATAIDRLLTA
jgi:hypothetical protein